MELKFSLKRYKWTKVFVSLHCVLEDSTFVLWHNVLDRKLVYFCDKRYVTSTLSLLIIVKVRSRLYFMFIRLLLIEGSFLYYIRDFAFLYFWIFGVFLCSRFVKIDCFSIKAYRAILQLSILVVLRFKSSVSHCFVYKLFFVLLILFVYASDVNHRHIL